MILYLIFLRHLKYIKTINEFRTVGFRYSEPKLGFNISFFYKGELNSKDISYNYI